ncbi:hypothetical protein [Blastococcus mobilis]|uniref:hypothetical protein n=1 Tax=Blastococcus mobilis TaxID=1938746 RepID=UPI00113009DE|nr:hypothetical protein [Blastococcus mobilis]
MQTDTARSTGPLLLAVLAGLAHLVVGYFSLVSGLVVPGYALIPLWILWLVLAAFPGPVGGRPLLVDAGDPGGGRPVPRAGPRPGRPGTRVAGLTQAPAATSAAS